jgi:hypothetical protein
MRMLCSREAGDEHTCVNDSANLVQLTRQEDTANETDTRGRR